MANPTTLSFGGNPAAGIAATTYNVNQGSAANTGSGSNNLVGTQVNTSPVGQASPAGGLQMPNSTPPSSPAVDNGGTQPPVANPPPTPTDTTTAGGVAGGAVGGTVGNPLSPTNFNATGANFSSSNISGTQPPNLYDLYNQELTNRGVNTANQQLLDISNQINQGQQTLAPLSPSMVQAQFPQALQPLQEGGATQAQLNLTAAQAAAPIQTAMSFLIQSRSALSDYITNQSTLAQQAVTNAQTEYENKLTAAGYIGAPQIFQDVQGNSYALLTKPDGSKEVDPLVDNQGNMNSSFSTQNSLPIGQRPSPSDPNTTEYYNTQTGQGFSSPQDLATYYNQQTKTNVATPQNVFDLINQKQAAQTTPSNGGGSASSGGNGSLVSDNPNSNSNIGGYDFTNYNESGGQNVATAYAQIPTINSANDAQSYINKVAPGSPITGAMVMASAQKYQIDPKVLLATMQGESNMGKAGLATQTFNPGNVGNNSATKTSPAKLNNLGNWQNGVDRVALNISERKIGASTTINTQPGKNAYGVDLSRIGFQPQSSYSAQVQQTSDSNHYLYINQSNLPSNIPASAVKTWAKNNGIQILTDADAKAVDISSQAQNLLSSPYVQQGLALLPHQVGPGINGSSILGQAGLLLQRGENSVEANLNQTDKGNVLNNFNNATGGAIKELQSLTQGAAGARFSSSLLSDVSSLNPNALSTYEGAQAQIGLIQNIYQQLNKLYFAGATPDLMSFVK